MELSEAESAVVAELNRILSSPAVDLEYDQLPGSHEGRALNADLARELSRDYRSKYDRLAYTRCTYTSCSNYVLDRLHRTLTLPGKPWTRSVLFLAGGAASGKTTTVGIETIKLYDLVFDSNLANFSKACGMIQAAVDARWMVDIDYIHRPYELALRSMIERAFDVGRYIPLGPPSKLARLHFDAQRTIVSLRKSFRDDLVGIDVWENLGTAKNPVKPKVIALSEVDTGGRYHYKSVQELHAIEANIIEEYREKIFGEDGVFSAFQEIER